MIHRLFIYHKFGAVALLSCVALSAAPGRSATAWSVEGHMITGALAYDELRAADPRAVRIIVRLMAQHPDRGRFESAADAVGGEVRARDEVRARGIFMEMARWPDDIRKGPYDHPTWHYAAKPLIDSAHPPPAAPAPTTAGSALEAFAFNAGVAADPHAAAAERAIALCWIFHLVGDIHQPLHAADEYSAAYPHGDRGGGLQYVLDPQSHRPISLHRYWDGAAVRPGEATPERADELRRRYPRKIFAELQRPGNAAADFASWAAESRALARTQVYRSDLAAGAEQLATALPAAYVANSSGVAERRLVLSSYRLADLLRVLLK